ncbi:MAG: tRNA preQ1(34) S-adenosylmethionine ribosyltransferase-isomerase QueA [Candidatus Omnitrophota bacterium]|jgi:S-adenosylmethionine:tRNA ribosyltransferase-isomerase
MKLSDFDYYLPKELIAQYPLEERDAARLLVIDREKGAIEHRAFRDITDYLQKGDLLILNNSKVLPSRLIGSRKTGGKVEFLLLRQKPGQGLVFETLIRPGRVRLNEKVIFSGGKIYGEVTGRNEITFSADSQEQVYGLGVMPLPPYIKRDSEELDKVYYQTIYAKENGSIASPTAGLHFTEGLLTRLRSRGVGVAHITLHISYSTFKPVKCEDLSSHKMDSEYFKIDKETQKMIEDTRVKGGRIFAVGTTACRTLETCASGSKEGHTDLFIYPGYEFRMTDCLVTNFHLPRTTLFMLVCAFAGEGLMKEAYKEAVDKKYRFYSYGDAMLIL